jgi:hypothetical protein
MVILVMSETSVYFNETTQGDNLKSHIVHIHPDAFFEILYKLLAMFTYFRHTFVVSKVNNSIGTYW